MELNLAFKKDDLTLEISVLREMKKNEKRLTYL